MRVFYKVGTKITLCSRDGLGISGSRNGTTDPIYVTMHQSYLCKIRLGGASNLQFINNKPTKPGSSKAHRTTTLARATSSHT